MKQPTEQNNRAESPSLEQLRDEIDSIDTEMAALFSERMALSAAVAEFKRENGLPIRDKTRERQILDCRSREIGAEIRPYYRAFFGEVISQSKRYQAKLLADSRVAYSGVEGAFAQIAATRLFPSAEKVGFSDFESAYRAVENGECDSCVLPIENSYAGDVDGVLELAYRGSLTVSGVFDMPLKQCLLAKPDVSVSQITEVTSHPQALAQCQPYLKEHGWKITPSMNTALSAKAVAESDRHDFAAIASKETASIFGLRVLEDGINRSDTNTTRFAVFTRKDVMLLPQHRSFLLLFTTGNRPGALEQAIGAVSRNGFNLRCLKSRPTGDENWAYYFYAEGEGSLATEAGSRMLREMSASCATVRVLGSFEAGSVTEQETKNTQEEAT